MKKLISIIIPLVIISQLLYQNAFALENNKTINYNIANSTNINTAGSDYSTVDNLAELKISIRDSLNARLKNFTIAYFGDSSNISNDTSSVLDSIFMNDEYLYYSISGYTCSFDKSLVCTIINLTFNYIGTPDENYVNSICQGIIADNTSPDDSDVTKIGKIHDYLVLYLHYDTSLTYYDTTSALKNKTATCQGYTLLMQKMLTMMGIKSMIINNDVDHIWNLVYINGYWYHIDVTFDDPTPDEEGRIDRTYFMVSDSFIKDDTHTWDESKYPKADAPIILGNPTPTQFIPSDIEGHWGQTYIQKLVDKGIINGYEDGSFRPDNTITRAEFCKIVIGALIKEKGYNFSSNTQTFTDVNPDEWYSKYIETAAQLSFVGGVGNNAFNPDAPITRQEMAKILSVVYTTLNGTDIGRLIADVNIEDYGFTDISSADEWAMDYIKAVLKTGIMKGDNNLFNPVGQVTRAETATVICRILGL